MFIQSILNQSHLFFFDFKILGATATYIVILIQFDSTPNELQVPHAMNNSQFSV